jgi:tetratricopeptide (TPR) repeat protein
MRRLAPFLSALVFCACGWNPSRPFDRDSPVVKGAIADLDAGDAGSAASKLEDYLSTGACKEGSIGTPDALKRRADGAFDLGLALFRVGEHYGRRFGEEEIGAGVDDATRERRHAQVECARRLVQAIAEDDALPAELRARARYLEGNLAFLDGAYEAAVRAYDRALVITPADVDGGDSVARDAAFNRAIALRRIEDQKDAGSDASRDASRDGAPDPGQDAARGDADSDRSNDAGKDGATSGKEGGSDQGKDAAPPPQERDASDSARDAGAPPPPSTNEDERMLDQLENAPTLQQEEAKRFAKKRVRGMADK